MQSTGNPAFSNEMLGNWAMERPASTTMTVQGTALKSLVMLVLLAASAVWSWSRAEAGTMAPGLLIGSAIAGMIVAFATIFRPTLAPYSAPVYAALEGVCLGGVSALINLRYPGIAFQAVSLTMGTLFCMLFIYATGLIRVTDRFIIGVTAATGAVCLIYAVSFILSIFGVRFPYIHESGPIGIAFGLFVVGLAAFNLLLDFEFIVRATNSQAPKSMEWYGAFGLMLTLVWLYLEILRLLSRIRDR